MRAPVIAAAVAAIVLVPRIGNVARAPTIVKQRIELRGADDLVKLLGSGVFELSRTTEKRAEGRGDWAADDTTTSSTKIDMKVAWDGKVLRLDGWVADRQTAFPRDALPRWSFASPQFADKHPPASWQKVFDQLRPLPPEITPFGDKRTRSFTLARSDRAVVTLSRLETYDQHNKPIELWSIDVAFGPIVAATAPTTSD
jgi:hypothetical protein